MVDFFRWSYSVQVNPGHTSVLDFALNRSVSLNPCNGLTHYDMARFFNLSGMYASAQAVAP